MLIDEESVVPKARCQHSSVMVGKSFFVFGGRNGNHVLNDLWVLTENFGNYTWHEVNTNIIPPRYGHALIPIEGYLFCIGGHNPTSDVDPFPKEVYCLNLANKFPKWIKFPNSNLPRGRIGFSSALYDEDNIFVYGGLEYDEECSTLFKCNQILQLDTQIRKGKKYKECYGQWIVDKRIGHGGEAQIYLVHHELDENKIFALRKVELKTMGEKVSKIEELFSRVNIDSNNEKTLNELQILFSLNHQNVIKIIKNFMIEIEKKVYSISIMPFCNLNNLEEYIKIHRQMSEKERFNLMLQFLEGLNYLVD